MIGQKAAAFPETYGQMETKFLIEVYTTGAERLRRSIEGLSEEDLRARPRPGKWTAKEIVAHTLESEVAGSLRMRYAIAAPDSVFLIYDQDVWANVFDYQNFSVQELENTLEIFSGLRERNIPLFRRATPADWQKTGIHPEFGKMTLRNLLELYTDHAERHIEQILQIRELIARPVEMPRPLPKRLFDV